MISLPNANHNRRGARFRVMSSEKPDEVKKETTQAVASQPQEEFIAPESVPSQSETAPPKPGTKQPQD